MFKPGDILVGKKWNPYRHTCEGVEVVVEPWDEDEVDVFRGSTSIRVRLTQGPMRLHTFLVTSSFFELRDLQLEND